MAYSDSTLQRMTKNDLIEQLRCAEHNQRAAEAMLNQQAENLKDWRPERHGRWILVQTASGKKYTVCSYCKADFSIRKENGNFAKLNMLGSSFCPNCGAMMDLKEDESRARRTS